MSGNQNLNFSSGLSPEEILARKEMEGGVQYDDPVTPESTNTNQLPEIKNVYDGFNPPPNLESEKAIQETPHSLGKAETVIRQETQSPITKETQTTQFSPGIEFGWKNLPLSVLPSKGLFYPDGTKIAIRPAETKEIRHYSSIDEDDFTDLNEKLNFIIEKCSIMKFPDIGIASYKDLKQEDRFFIVMAIRDLTFLQGENRIILTPETKCESKKSCPINSGIELRTGILSSYEIDQKIMNYYSARDRNFIFPVKKLEKEISMYIPSIGVMSAISDFVTKSSINEIEVDESFIKIAPFIIPEWRGLNEKEILKKMRESDSWSKEEFSLYFELSEAIKIGTELDVNLSCPSCGAEVTAPITFPRGFRSLFVISDIFGELL